MELTAAVELEKIRSKQRMRAKDKYRRKKAQGYIKVNGWLPKNLKKALDKYCEQAGIETSEGLERAVEMLAGRLIERNFDQMEFNEEIHSACNGEGCKTCNFTGWFLTEKN